MSSSSGPGCLHVCTCRCCKSFLLLQPCERTQLDFMAEQCSQTNVQPLYLQPQVASYYTWIPAVGFSQGETTENTPLELTLGSFVGNWTSTRIDPARQHDLNVRSFTRLVTDICVTVVSRRRAVQDNVSVRGREVHRESWFSVCGRNTLRATQPTSPRRHGRLSERNMSGRKDIQHAREQASSL